VLRTYLAKLFSVDGLELAQGFGNFDFTIFG
jgi:hypothetical protein